MMGEDNRTALRFELEDLFGKGRGGNHDLI
jgi:hypothetical protein